jgi:hypothetical protein
MSNKPTTSTKTFAEKHNVPETYQDLEYERRYSKKEILNRVRQGLSENVSIDYLITWINQTF